MKVFLAIVILFITCSMSVAQDEGQRVDVAFPQETSVNSTPSFPSNVQPKTEPRSVGTVTVRQKPRRQVNANVSRQRIARLERAVESARRHHNSAAVTRLQKQLIRIRLELANLNGAAHQVKTSNYLQDMGYRTRGQLRREMDRLYVSVQEYEVDRAEQTQPKQSSTSKSDETSAPATKAVATVTKNTGNGESKMTPGSFVVWTLATIPALILIGVLCWFLNGRYKNFIKGIKGLVNAGTTSGNFYEVKGNYGPFRVKYRK